MKIEIKYSKSEGPHVIIISIDEINNMINSGQLVVTQPTPTGTKTITFSGSETELLAMAEAFRSQI